MLLPAKVVSVVVRAAMEGAVLHARRTATAMAERRRRSLLSSRAQFRHNMEKNPKVGVLLGFVSRDSLCFLKRFVPTTHRKNISDYRGTYSRSPTFEEGLVLHVTPGNSLTMHAEGKGKNAVVPERGT